MHYAKQYFYNFRLLITTINKYRAYLHIHRLTVNCSFQVILAFRINKFPLKPVNIMQQTIMRSKPNRNAILKLGTVGACTLFTTH